MDCSRAKTCDPDLWLETAPAFSRPIARQLRDWIQRWEPDLAESIKWNILCFSGRKLVCGLSACKNHLSLAFFRGTDLADPARLFSGGENNTNILSIRLTTLDSLDREALRRMLRNAVTLDRQPDLPPLPKVKREHWPMPEFFAAALTKEQRAKDYFASLAPTCQREYIVWLATAKREETRAKRLAEAIAALVAGRKWAQRRLL